MVSDLKVYIKQMGIIEFLHVETMAPIDFYQCFFFLNVFGDQTVDMSIVSWWLINFSSGANDVYEKVSHLCFHKIYRCSIQALVYCR